MAKIFSTSYSEPCVDFLFQIGSRVVDAVNPGVSETSFISFWDDMIRHGLNYVLYLYLMDDWDESDLIGQYFMLVSFTLE